MTAARVDRLVIADSMPVMHAAVNAVQRRGPADLLRFPDIVGVLGGRSSETLQRCIMDQIVTCRKLHGISEIAVVACELADYNDAVGNIGQMLGRQVKGRWQFERVVPDLPPSELAPGIAGTWDECTVTCVDYREPFAAARDRLRQSNRHEIAVPGAVKRIVEDPVFSAHVLLQLHSRGLLVRVFQHEDCGAYGPELHEDSPAELAQHRTDVLRFATLAEMHGVRFAGGWLIELAGTIRRF